MATEEPAVMPAAMHDDDDDEEILVVKRHKRSRPVVKDAEGAVDENAEDTSPRGPIDASQADSPDKSSDDERADDEDGLPGKKKLKLRRKGAIQEEEEKKANEPAWMADLDNDGLELDDDANGEEDDVEYEEEDVVYGSDDEEGQMEVMLKKKGTLDGFGIEEDAANGSGEEEESDESDLEDSEDERELEDEVQRLKTEAAKRMAATKTAKPPPENETEEERMAREKSETAEAQREIMREAAKRAHFAGYHQVPDRDPFAYRKIFAELNRVKDALNLPPPPPSPTMSDDEDAGDFDGEEDDEDGDFLDDDEEAELDSQAGDDEDGPAKKKEKKPEEEEMMVELDVVDDDDDDDLGYDQDALNKMLAEVQARAAASKANAAAEAEAEVIEQVQRETADPIHVSDGQWQGDPADAPTAAKAGEEPKDKAAPVVDFNDEEAILREKAAQNLRDKREAAKEAVGPEDEEDEEEEEEEADSEDDLSEEETVEMTRKERLRQLKAAKAFFKADAKAADRAARGEVLEDEAELSDDGGHTDDEEEVEVEVGEGEDRVIRRVRAKRGDGLLDREELEEMVDYIDFNESKDDDERRAAKRAAAHARFEEERDDEELKKMHEALKNGFRRPNKNGELDDGPDYWQRRMRQKEDGDSDGDEFEIDIPDRAWEVVELSDDDDGAAQEWAEQAERRKKAASAREAAKKERESQRESQGLDSQDVDVDEDSQLMSAKDFGFLGSQDFKSMMAAGKSRRRRVGTGLAAAAMETQASAGSLPSHPSGSMPAPAPRHAKAPGLDRASSMSFLGKSGGGSRSNHGSNGLQRSFSLGGGASRSFVFGGGGDSQSMWDKDMEENGTAPAPTVLAELGGGDNANFGWAKEAAAKPAAKSKLGGGSQSLFGMLQASQDWDDQALTRSDSLTEAVKAAKDIKMRPAMPRGN